MAAQLTDNQKAWVAELRSGNRRQTNGVLKRIEPEGESFCCLGVASEMSGLCVQRRNENGLNYTNVFFKPVDRESSSVYETFPPGEVLVWLGAVSPAAQLGSGDVNLAVPHEIYRLEQQGLESDFSFYEANPNERRQHIGGMTAANLNDDGFTFDQIADCIEYFGIAER